MKMLKQVVIISAVLFTATTNAQATTYDFTYGGTSSTTVGSGFGNERIFDDLTVSAWATTGVPTSSNALLDSSQLLKFGTGLGACNRDEGTNCRNPIHQVDNVGDDDLILFIFDRQVQFDDIIIDPYGKYDRDVSFWIADISNPDLTGLDPNTLIDGTSVFGGITDDFNSRGYGPLTIDLGGRVGNALLFSAYLNLSNDPYYKYYDRFKISALTTTDIPQVVPVPAAAWLFGSGILGLVAVARRKPLVASCS